VSKRVSVSFDNGPSLFTLNRLSSTAELETFDCSIKEYNEYLIQEAHRAQSEYIAITWLLRERKNGNLASYMSLINDAIKLNATEKDLHHLDYPFKTIPAMKIAKLAVSESSREQFTGIGSYMIYLATFIAVASNEQLSACRFLTVDADIERNKSVIEFYRKNGFIPNNELNNKRSKTISMRKDILIQSE
jgi:ribosomal protein S18 acetylase RimI-like enzyme